MLVAITAAQRLDSRGNPTVQVDVTTKKGPFISNLHRILVVRS